MAKKRTAIVVRSAPRHHSAPRPIVIRAPSPVARHKKGHRGGRRGHMSSEKVLMALAIGGLALGFADKSAMAIPTIPILGKAGTIALATHFLGKGKAGVVTDIRNAAIVVAAYEFGKDGKVSGDGTEGEVLGHARHG